MKQSQITIRKDHKGHKDRNWKPVEEVLPLHKAQLLTYMRLLKKRLGLLINFHELVLKDGITRLTL